MGRVSQHSRLAQVVGAASESSDAHGADSAGGSCQKVPWREWERNNHMLETQIKPPPHQKTDLLKKVLKYYYCHQKNTGRKTYFEELIL